MWYFDFHEALEYPQNIFLFVEFEVKWVLGHCKHEEVHCISCLKDIASNLNYARITI